MNAALRMLCLALAVFFTGSCVIREAPSQSQVRVDSPAYPSATSTQRPASYGTYVPSLPVSHPPYAEFHASWLQRLGQAYVYYEHRGPYTQTATTIPTVLREMRIQGLEADGPPFCLFYQDPASTPAEQLISRACIPIAGPRSPTTPLRYDVLPERTVVQAFVSGPYPEVPRSYPHLLDYMISAQWTIDGPIRETYIVPPSLARTPTDLLCEIQVPVKRAGL